MGFEGFRSRRSVGLQIQDLRFQGSFLVKLATKGLGFRV